ncbi:MAG TPA: FixH family protein [Ignavibacteria bacterium]|nr:FixH family protein [Ignavibacteria bacterium]
MKISWGIKITILYTVFAVGIISMVVIAMNNPSDLVSENYYEQEIRYQSQIDILKASAELNKKINIVQEGEFIILTIFDTSKQEKYEGEIRFYRSSDAGKDFKIPFSADINGIQKIEAAYLEKGMWKINLFLKNKGTDYFITRNIFVN